MSLFEEYLAQTNNDYNSTGHYDVHTDKWVDEGSLPNGHSGHCDVHTDDGE